MIYLELQWQHDYGKEKAAEIAEAFRKASSSDKADMIAGTYGIFDGRLEGDVYTYWYHVTNSTIVNRRAFSAPVVRRRCYRIRYNIRTDEIKETELRRMVAQARHNYGRSL